MTFGVQPGNGFHRSMSTRDVAGANKSTNNAATAVSVPPRPQSILYCELRFLLHQATDAFLRDMWSKGFLSVSRLKKIDDVYVGHGRPRVLGFFYDFETQLSLVLIHAEHAEFQFFGPKRFDRAAILSCLRAALVDARQMQVHNYCFNDTVIAKHLIDAHLLLEFFGSGPEHYGILAKCGIFFKKYIDFESGDYEGRAAQAVYTGHEELAVPDKEQKEEADQEIEAVRNQEPETQSAPDTEHMRLAELVFEAASPKLHLPVHES